MPPRNHPNTSIAKPPTSRRTLNTSLTTIEQTAFLKWCLTHQARYAIRTVESYETFWLECRHFIKNELGKEFAFPGPLLREFDAYYRVHRGDDDIAGADVMELTRALKACVGISHDLRDLKGDGSRHRLGLINAPTASAASTQAQSRGVKRLRSDEEAVVEVKKEDGAPRTGDNDPVNASPESLPRTHSSQSISMHGPAPGSSQQRHPKRVRYDQDANDSPSTRHEPWESRDTHNGLKMDSQTRDEIIGLFKEMNLKLDRVLRSLDNIAERRRMSR